jgi:hypothetical protein
MLVFSLVVSICDPLDLSLSMHIYCSQCAYVEHPKLPWTWCINVDMDSDSFIAKIHLLNVQLNDLLVRVRIRGSWPFSFGSFIM